MNGRKRLFVVTSATAMMAAGAFSLHAGQKVLLGWKWVRGQSYDVRMVTDSNAVQRLRPLEQSQASVGFGYRIEVMDVNAQGEATADCTVTWIRVREKSGTREMVYDSADRDHPFPPEAQGSFPAGLLGQTFTVRLSRQGQLRDVRGLGAMRDNIVARVPEGPTRQQVAEGITEEQLAKVVRDVLRPLAIYPSTPIGAGDSWSQRETLEPPPYEHVTRWTLKSRRSGTALIEVDTAMTPRMPGPATPGRARGQIEVEEATGRILHSRTTATWSQETPLGSSAAGTQRTSVTVFEMMERKTTDKP